MMKTNSIQGFISQNRFTFLLLILIRTLISITVNTANMQMSQYGTIKHSAYHHAQVPPPEAESRPLFFLMPLAWWSVVLSYSFLCDTDTSCVALDMHA